MNQADRELIVDCIKTAILRTKIDLQASLVAESPLQARGYSAMVQQLESALAAFIAEQATLEAQSQSKIEERE